MTVRSGFPIILTSDLAAEEAFYRDAFDAERTFTFTAPDGADGYISLAVGSAELGIGAEADAPAGGGNVEVWFYVDDVDESYRRALAAGAESIQEPVDQPWGERMALLRDPAGVMLNLGSPPPDRG